MTSGEVKVIFISAVVFSGILTVTVPFTSFSLNSLYTVELFAYMLLNGTIVVTVITRAETTTDTFVLFMYIILSYCEETAVPSSFMDIMVILSGVTSEFLGI